MIQDGGFRQDLFYRLNVMPIYLPSLRERADDIPALVEHFIRKFNQLHGRNIHGIEETALEALKKFSWPGNIRELENAIERAFVMELGEKISLQALPENISGISPAEALAAPAPQESEHELEGASDLHIAGIDYQVEKEEFERQFIINALKRFGGRINQTVVHANIPKNTLLRKIRKYDIKSWEYGASAHDHQELHPDETL